MSCRIITLAVILAVCGAPADSSEAIDPQLQPLLVDTDSDEKIAVIIRLSDRVDPGDLSPGSKSRRRGELIRALRQKAATSQSPIRSFLESKGVHDAVSLLLINGVAFEARPDVIRELATLPGIESVRLDRKIRLPRAALRDPSRPTRKRDRAPLSRAIAAVEWNIAMIRAPDLWALGSDGTGVVVASLDSGVDSSHPDLMSRWRGEPNGWFDPNAEHATPHDSSGHGTNTMGLILGGSAGGTDIGVAPGAEWIAAKIFDNVGDASFSAIHQSFDWVLDPDGDPLTDDSADVVNNSWGLRDNVNECILEFQLDIQTLKAAGIAVVFSAGNAGSGASTSLSPANNPEGFATGMVDASMTVDGQSSRGPATCDSTIYPEVVAPGVFVWTSDLLGGYVEEIGTSFAAPHVSGAMAVLLQAYPGATVGELESVLKDSALDLGTAGPDNAYGYGLIDLVQANTLMPTLPCTDNDGDGFGVGANCFIPDCDDTDAQVWGIPGAATNLRFGPDHQTLSWDAPLQTGGAAATLRYDTLRSETASDFVAAATQCLEWDDASDMSTLDPQDPVPGQVLYYLIRSENDCVLGQSLGTSSDDVTRTGRACP
jgi:serine protease AprX